MIFDIQYKMFMETIFLLQRYNRALAAYQYRMYLISNQEAKRGKINKTMCENKNSSERAL